MAEAATSFLNWNWAGEHVQAELTNGEYVSAESTLLLAGPSRLDMLTQVDGGGGTPDISFVKSQLYPIGLVQNFMMAQNRFLTRLFEIGSKRAYFVTGRLAVNFQLNRIIFFGPSLIRLLYALAPDNEGFGGNAFKFVPNGQPGASLDVKLKPPKAYADLFPSKYMVPAGYGGTDGKDNRDFFINLASDLLQIPFGLGAIFKDAKNRPYGACYLQEALLEAHSMGVDANNVVIAEGCNGQCDRVEPIQLISAS